MALSTTKASMSMSKTRTQRQQEPEDPQVAVIRNDPPFPTLCEAVTDEMMKGRNPKRPILTRLVYVAEVVSKEEPLKNVLENINNAASKFVNANDPTGGIISVNGGESAASPTAGGAPTVNVSGVCVELGTHVVCCLESEPTHIAQVMIETQRRAIALPPAPAAATSTAGRLKARNSVGSEAQQGGSAAAATNNNNTTGGGSSGAVSTAGVLKNLRVLYLVDDIISRTTQHWVHIDATRSKASLAAKKEEGAPKTPAHSSFARLDDSIVKAVHNIIGIGAHAQGLNKGQREHFASTGAATSHAHLLPTVPLLESCMDSGLCLTLDEYISVFTTVPVVTRDFDVNHPVEPPLVYE